MIRARVPLACLGAAIGAGVAVVASAGPAAADPVSLIAGGVISFLSGTPVITAVGMGGLITIGNVVGGVLVSGAVLGLQMLAGGAARRRPDPAQAKQNVTASESPRLRALGRVRVGGVLAFGNSVSVQKYRLDLWVDREIDGVEEWWLGGREVTVDPDGAVSSPPWVYPGGSYARVQWKPGRDDHPAWSELVSQFPTLWSLQHRARGIAQALWRFTSPGVSSAKYLKLYSGGEPERAVVMRGERVFDPRTGLTAWSDNGVLCVLHVCLIYPELTFDDFDLAQIGAEATKADALVATRTGGTRKRSRFAGILSEEEAREGLLQDALDSTGCRLVDRPNGLLGIELIDDAVTPVLTLQPRHIAKFGLQSGPQAVERPNRARVKFYSAERQYEMAEINLAGIGWAEVPDEIEAYGEKVADYELRFCPDAEQAQHIARRMFATARADRAQITTSGMQGLAVMRETAIAIVDEDLGVTHVGWCGAVTIDIEQRNTSFGLVLAPDLPAWDPAVHAAPAPAPIPPIEYATALPQPAAPLAATVVTWPDATVWTRVSYPAIPGAVITEATARYFPGGLPSGWFSMTEYQRGALSFAEIAANFLDTDGEFRVRGFDTAEEGSVWSPVLALRVTREDAAPAAPTITAQYPAPGVADSTRITVTAPLSLHVAAMTFTGLGAPAGVVAVRPGDSFTWVVETLAETTDRTLTWTVTARNSIGTTSPVATVSVLIPGTA